MSRTYELPYDFGEEVHIGQSGVGLVGTVIGYELRNSDLTVRVMWVVDGRVYSEYMPDYMVRPIASLADLITSFAGLRSAE